MMTYSATSLPSNGKARQFFYRNNSTDAAVINQVWIERQYNCSRLGRAGELREYAKEMASKALKPLVIDAGANIGASAVYFF